jgi:hypothetical protein
MEAPQSAPRNVPKNISGITLVQRLHTTQGPFTGQPMGILIPGRSDSKAIAHRFVTRPACGTCGVRLIQLSRLTMLRGQHQNFMNIRTGCRLSLCVDCTFRSTKKLDQDILDLLNKYKISGLCGFPLANP